MKRIDFCDGWEFSRNGEAFAPVAVPHDAMLGNRRDADAPARSASGYFHGASYRYRKRFELSPEQAASTLMLAFDGIYRDASVQVNGTPVEVPPYGFLPFSIDLTGLVRDGENLVEVFCSNADQPDCRWYSGAGIYRPVWLLQSGTAHIPPDGVRVTTVSLSPPTVRVDVECARMPADGRIDIAICGNESLPQGKNSSDRICSMSFSPGAKTHSSAACVPLLEIPDAKLWSAEQPHLYRCIVELVDAEGAVLDSAETRFGIRTLEWGPHGLLVNGQMTLLRGGCIHCDNGILGAASWPQSEYRRIRLLKNAGFNAVRIAHNPAPAALLDACDELGMYVMEETWDTWYTPKSRFDYAQHFLDRCDADLRAIVRRDFNHPSVIMYSIGNELADPITAEGAALERSLVDLLHALDPTRPVTCGLNLAMMLMERVGSRWYGNAEGVSEKVGKAEAPRSSLMFNLAAQSFGTRMVWLSRVPGADAITSPALDALDIAGYNYASARYELDARKHPERVIVGSETFPHELARNWRLCLQIPSLIGDFMWAAWDYLGEAGAGAWAYTPEEAGFVKPWPWLAAGSGALDILGHPNGAAALAAAVWDTASGPSIQVRPVDRMIGFTYKATWRGTDAIPSWSWFGCTGIRTDVEVYDGRARAIRLVLNGRIVGEAPVHDCIARFSVAYEPGILQALALDGEGRVIGYDELVSAQAPFHLEPFVENATASRAPEPPQAGGIAYVGFAITGANGPIESAFDEQLTCTVEGGELLAFGSAQPAPTESYQDGVFTSYRGRALAIVRRTKPGRALVTVRGTTLTPVTVEVDFA